MRGLNRRLLLIGITAVALAVVTTPAYAERPGKPSRHTYPPVGIFIELGDDFHRELGAYDDNTRTLSTDMSETYLHQIAIATRYTVETNLKILQQQKRIIELLEKQQQGSAP